MITNIGLRMMLMSVAESRKTSLLPYLSELSDTFTGPKLKSGHASTLQD